MLLSERYTNDCDAEDDSPEEMGERDSEASQKPPYHVHEACETSRRKTVVGHVSAERPQRHYRKFHSLESERYSNDGDHHEQARHGVFQRDHESAEYDPDNVQENIHMPLVFTISQ